MFIGFDIETTGDLQEYALQPWRVDTAQARILTWAVADGVRPAQAVVAPEQHDACSEQLTALVSQWVTDNAVVCVWNALFEIAWLSRYVDHALLAKVRWLDGMLLWRHLDNIPDYDVQASKRRSFGLKAAVKQFLPEYAGYEEGITFDGSTSIDALLRYNAIDADVTRQLAILFLQHLKQSPKQLAAARIEAQCLVPIALANVRGLLVDEHALDELDAVLADKVQTLSKALAEHGVGQEVLASPVQLRDVLFDEWGLPVLKYGKTGASTDKQVLHELGLFDERARMIREYREAVGNRRKFVDTLRESIRYSGTGRTYPQARVFGTYTGRITYASSQGRGKAKRQIGWALHQMKRAAEYRRVIRARDGYQIVEFDAAGQEFRLMAWLSGDEHMLRLCQPGEDAHAFMGAQIAGVSYEEVKEGAKHDKRLKEMRQLGKIANLSCQYRTSAEKLRVVARVQYGIDMDDQTARHIHATYHKSYPGVQRYWQRQIDHINRYLYVSTLAGRVVTVTREMLLKDSWSVHSTAINYPVQGSGADQKYLAISTVRPILAEYGAVFLFDLHDGLYFEVREELVDRFISAMRSALSSLPYLTAWGVQPPIPLPFDCKVGPTWGDLVEV